LLNILLINPNDMKHPPVIPIGLEYLKTYLMKDGYSVKILDLCFETRPLKKLQNILQENTYDIAGITIRNIDLSSYYRNKFYLPRIKKIVEIIKNYGIPVILGGAGFTAMPEEILSYLRADYGIVGPGEKAFTDFLDKWKKNKLEKNILNGWQFIPDYDLIHYRGKDVDYKKYISDGGIVGFETHKGCSGLCPYCIEAKNPLHFKKIPNIIEELKFLITNGFDHFHLCDSEFNDDLAYSIKFCEKLIEARLKLKWTLYMKPSPYNEHLFRLLHDSNAYLITLSVDSYEKFHKLNNYSYQDLENIINYCKKYNIQLDIDLLCGYPGEPKESIIKMIKFFKETRPNNVGITFYYRIYNHTQLANIIKNNFKFQKRLTRKLQDPEDFLEPIFYSNYDIKFFKKLIDKDKIFRISGLKPGVNYQL